MKVSRIQEIRKNTILIRLHRDKQEGVSHSTESMYFQSPVLLVSYGTVKFNCHAQVTPSDIMLGMVLIISQRVEKDPPSKVSNFVISLLGNS